MNVTCPNCATVYRVDPAKVPQAGVRARCAVCSAVFAVSHEKANVPVPRREEPAAQAVPPPPVPPPPAPVAPVSPPLPSAAPAVSAFGTQAPSPQAPSPQASAPQAPAPSASVPPSPPPSPASSRSMPAAAPPRPVMPPPPAVAGGLPSRPAAPVRTQQQAQPPALHSPPQPSVRPSTAPPGPGGRPANPFLSQDPSLKARRLARALVSDIVVYHPAKRQEGLRDGNLKELFEEEIKKSYEEFTEQVGRDVAESTGFFREALNEILAGGRQVF
jgi:predicted Zn finger-like uncharacterized protein